MLIQRISSTRVSCDNTRRVAITIGNFDGVHRGHQAMLQRLIEAAKTRGLPPCVMTFEPHPREFLAPESAPTRLSSVREKIALLHAHGVEELWLCRFDARFARLSADEFATLIYEHLGARWLLVGGDFRFGARRSGDVQLLQARGARAGAEVALMPMVEIDGQRVSSTAVRKALAAGDLILARTLLGRAYRICGRVSHGRKLGRQIGFPTANILLKRARAPLAGIFAVKFHGLGEVRYGAASLGVKPTVSNSNRPTLEVHLFDFQDNIYGAHVEVEFCQKLRDEAKYDNLEALRVQIATDVAQARAYFQLR